MPDHQEQAAPPAVTTTSTPVPPLDPPQASAEPYRLTKEEQQHMRNALLRSVKVVDGPA